MAGELKCPRGRACDVPSCRHAFACGALPSSGTSRTAYLIAIAIPFLFAIMVGTIVRLTSGPLDLQFKAWRIAPVCAVLIGVPAGIVGLRSFYVRRHIRAVAAVARDMKLTFLMNVPRGDRLARLPVPLFRDEIGDVRLDGEVSGRRVEVVHFQYDWHGNGIYVSFIACVVQDLPTAGGQFALLHKTTRPPIGSGSTWQRTSLDLPTSWPADLRKQYRLLAPDERAAQFATTPQVLAFIREHVGWSVMVTLDPAGESRDGDRKMFAWSDAWGTFDVSRFPHDPAAIRKDIETSLELAALLERS